MEVEKELCESWRVWIDEENHIVPYCIKCKLVIHLG